MQSHGGNLSSVTIPITNRQAWRHNICVNILYLRLQLPRMFLQSTEIMTKITISNKKCPFFYNYNNKDTIGYSHPFLINF